jgi:Holliday junction resolvase RusA-like endonuclease
VSGSEHLLTLPGGVVLTMYGFPGVQPEPWTSPTASIGRRSGKLMAQVHKNPKVRSYQEELKEEFSRRYPKQKPLRGDLEVHFWFWRNVPTTGSYADATNLQKSTEDALQDLLYFNDKQVQQATSTVAQQGPGVPPMIAVGVRGFVRERVPSQDLINMFPPEVQVGASPDLTFSPEDLF